jgi:tetratricopeptide (TPR) repeat protein
MRVFAFALTLLLCGLTAGQAAAQAKPDYAAARKHYMAAQQAEKIGEWDIAVAEYAAAYDITKDAKILYSIGKAYEAAGNKDAAVVYYRRYLNEAKEAKDRDEVRARVEQLEKSTPAPTPPTPTPTPTPPSGDDKILAPPPEETPAAADVETPPPGHDDAPVFYDGTSRWARTAAWVSVGVAAVALTTGAVLGESARSRAEDIDRLQTFRDPDGYPTTYTDNVQQEYEDALDEGDSLETMSIVAFSVAGVAAASAVVFFILDPGPVEGPAVVGKRKRFVAPAVGRDSLGVTAGWSF